MLVNTAVVEGRADRLKTTRIAMYNVFGERDLFFFEVFIYASGHIV